jgi:thiol-disulfide isomerase/thioredoxin
LDLEKMMRRFSLPVVALAAFAVAFAARHQAGIAANAPPPQGSPLPLGRPVPDISVKGLDGKYVKLSSLRGKPVFLDFWATWCGPCRLSLPHTNKLAKLHGKDITVLAISDEDAPTIQAFMKEGKYTYPVYRDISDAAALALKIDSLPTFIVIDKDGNLVDYQKGFANSDPVDAALLKVGIK